MGPSAGGVGLESVLDDEQQLPGLDLFDRVQLEAVVRVCRDRRRCGCGLRALAGTVPAVASLAPTEDREGAPDQRQHTPEVLVAEPAEPIVHQLPDRAVVEQDHCIAGQEAIEPGCGSGRP